MHTYTKIKHKMADRRFKKIRMIRTTVFLLIDSMSSNTHYKKKRDIKPRRKLERKRSVSYKKGTWNKKIPNVAN